MRELVEGYRAEWAPGKSFGAIGDRYAVYGVPMNVGGEVHYEGNAYELIDKAGGGETGTAAPIHRDGVATDGQYYWKYLHSGAGYVKITAFVNANKVTADVVKLLPRTTAFTPKFISAVANTTPIRITTATNHDLETGDLVWIEGTGLAGINNQSFTVTRVAATTFDLVGTVASGAFGAGGGAIRLRSTGGVVSINTTQVVRPNKWSFGAWSPARGYPRAVAFFEDRHGGR